MYVDSRSDSSLVCTFPTNTRQRRRYPGSSLPPPSARRLCPASVLRALNTRQLAGAGGAGGL
eukprot:420447-Pyramimonas_sp.AAC.1